MQQISAAPIATTTISTSSQPILENKKTSQNQTGGTSTNSAKNAKDVSDMSTVLETAITQLENLKKQIQDFDDHVNANQIEFGTSIPTLSQVTSTVNMGDVTEIASIEAYIVTLRSYENTLITDGYVQQPYWSDTVIPNIVSSQEKFVQDFLQIEGLYNQLLNQFAQTLHTQNQYQSQYQTPAIQAPQTDCNQLLSDAEQSVAADVTKGGGDATQSYILAAAIKKLKADGHSECVY